MPLGCDIAGVQLQEIDRMPNQDERMRGMMKKTQGRQHCRALDYRSPESRASGCDGKSAR